MSAPEFRRRLAAVVSQKYGSAAEASRAIHMNQNYISNTLKNEEAFPGVDVLQRMAQEFGWPLHDVVDWCLGLPPGNRDVSPEAEARRGLERMGCNPSQAEDLLKLAKELARLAAQQNDSPQLARNAN